MKRLNLKGIDNNMPTLFDFPAAEPATTTFAPIAAPVAPAAPAPEAAVPDFFEETLEKIKTFAQTNALTEIFALAGRKDYIHLHHTSNIYNAEYLVGGNVAGPWPNLSAGRYGWRNTVNDQGAYNLTGSWDNRVFTATVMFAALSADGTEKVLPVTFTLRKPNPETESVECTDIVPGKWQPLKKYYPNLTWLQNDATLTENLKENKPYVFDWLREANYDMYCYLAAPWMETLCKAGYAFAREFMISPRNFTGAAADMLNRLTQPGTKPANIFKTEKCLYTALKNETNLSVWDVYRRMVKGGRLNQDTIRQALDHGYRERELEIISSILAARHNDRPVFTWTSLMNYLGRIEMYEALEGRYALEHLRDYLGCCRTLDMEPRIDSDSLLREHNVAARLCRQRRDEIVARELAEMKERVKDMIPRLEYHENTYFIRPIFDYDALMDEATQQHNCLACYADRIARGDTYILQMRETAHPEKSLISIELSPDMRTIRQKYLAHNQAIHNKSQSEFIERWFKQLHEAPATAPAAEAETAEPATQPELPTLDDILTEAA